MKHIFVKGCNLDFAQYCEDGVISFTCNFFPSHPFSTFAFLEHLDAQLKYAKAFMCQIMHKNLMNNKKVVNQNQLICENNQTLLNSMKKCSQSIITALGVSLLKNEVFSRKKYSVSTVDKFLQFKNYSQMDLAAACLSLLCILTVLSHSCPHCTQAALTFSIVLDQGLRKHDKKLFVKVPSNVFRCSPTTRFSPKRLNIEFVIFWVHFSSGQNQILF